MAALPQVLSGRSCFVALSDLAQDVYRPADGQGRRQDEGGDQERVVDQLGALQPHEVQNRRQRLRVGGGEDEDKTYGKRRSQENEIRFHPRSPRAKGS